MNAKTSSIIDSGMDGIVIDVECQISKGLPNIIIVGFASRAVDESKERIKSAFTNAGLTFPRKRITVNLAPGDIQKNGTGLDLAIAAAILIASEQVKSLSYSAVFIGELGLNGDVRPVRGILGKLLKARSLGIDACFVPIGNIDQAQAIDGISLYPVANLSDLYLHLSGTHNITTRTYSPAGIRPNTEDHAIDMADVSGQQTAKRALEIAAAGGHNILLNGPPGTGKSMLAKAFRGILPAMTQNEMIEVTHLHSLSGNNYQSIISTRPFRTPHHTASNTAIVGGGQYPRPGEISLSHRGVLFLDELPEFSRVAIEALRQPLEDKTITISRSQGNIQFPADFILIATANPCPCGYYGTATECECPPQQIIRYQRKLSGPIIDRIDIYVEVQEVEHAELLDNSMTRETSTKVQARVQNARNVQAKRFNDDLIINGSMSNKQIKKLSNISEPAVLLLNTAGQRLKISARNYMRIIKVARTIADLEGSEAITPIHVSEALQYRQKQSTFSDISA